MHIQYSQQEKDVFLQIGGFYLQKNNNDYAKTEKDLQNLQITNIVVGTTEVIIYLARPGLLIGKRGTNVEALEKFLNKKVHIEEQESFLELITPVDYSYDDYYDGRPPTQKVSVFWDNNYRCYRIINLTTGHIYSSEFDTEVNALRAIDFDKHTNPTITLTLAEINNALR